MSLLLAPSCCLSRLAWSVLFFVRWSGQYFYLPVSVSGEHCNMNCTDQKEAASKLPGHLKTVVVLW